MRLSVKIVAFLLGILFFLVFFSLARKKNVKPFYSALWLFISGFMISLVIFEGFYKWIASLFGIYDATIMIIIALITFLLMYVLYLSLKISDLSDKIQELISMVAILEKKVRDDN